MNKNMGIILRLIVLIVFLFTVKTLYSSPFGEANFSLQESPKKSYLTLVINDKIGVHSLDEPANEIISRSLVGDTRPLIVFLDTPGGAVSATMKLLNAFESWQGAVVTVNMNRAYSAGAFLYSAGDLRVSATNSEFFFHGVQMGLFGTFINKVNIKQLEKDIDDINDRLIKVVLRNTGLTPEKLKQVFDVMDEDNYIGIEEMASLGLVDMNLNQLISVLNNLEK